MFKAERKENGKLMENKKVKDREGNQAKQKFE